MTQWAKDPSVHFATMSPTTITSICALVFSVLSLLTTWQLWRRTNRPVVSVAVETVSPGKMGTALKLVVSNVGNRPAKDIRLSVDAAALARLLTNGPDDPLTAAVRKCFSPNSAIPLLIAGRSTECSFGFLAVGLPSSTWREQTTLAMSVTYRDLETGRDFRQVVNVRIADNTSFTGSMWAVKQAS